MSETRMLFQGQQVQMDDGLFKLLMEISGKIDGVVESHDETRTMLENHMKSEEHMINIFKDAFPGGDANGHRSYHEEVISQVKARKEFWQKLSLELVKWGLIGFVGWAVVQMWHGVLQGPK